MSYILLLSKNILWDKPAAFPRVLLLHDDDGEFYLTPRNSSPLRRVVRQTDSVSPRHVGGGGGRHSAP